MVAISLLFYLGLFVMGAVMVAMGVWGSLRRRHHQAGPLMLAGSAVALLALVRLSFIYAHWG